MIFYTVLNRNVARDPETQAMRRRMNLLLSANLVGFALLAMYIGFAESPTG